MVFKLQSDKKEDDETIRELREAIRQLRSEINETVDRLTIEKGELQKEVNNLHKENSELEKKVKRQERRIRHYEDNDRKTKLQDSTNSNNPTSSYRFGDSVKKPHVVNSRVKSGKQRGGQAGHEVHRSRLRPEADTIRDYTVRTAPAGAERVTGKEGNTLYYRTQIIDMTVNTHITECRFHISESGGVTPTDLMNSFRVNSVIYSQNMKSQVLFLHGKGIISLNRLCEIINAVSRDRIQISEGTIVNWEKELNGKAVPCTSEILNRLLKEKVLNVDETSVRINGKTAWLHVITGESGAYFIITEKRSDEKTGPLYILRDYKGVLMHDHLKSYYRLKKCIHAECNAHIDRYLKSGYEIDEIDGCRQAEEQLHGILTRKKDLMAAGQDHMEIAEYNEYRERLLDLLREQVKNYEDSHPDLPAKYIPEGLRTMKRMAEYIDEHLRFIEDFDVGYTNNAAERMCRASKARKKISGQCYSMETSAYLSTMLTITQTARVRKESCLNMIQSIMKDNQRSN